MLLRTVPGEAKCSNGHSISQLSVDNTLKTMINWFVEMREREGGGGGREGERETEGERDTDKDRQTETDRHKDKRQKETKTDRQTIYTPFAFLQRLVYIH